MPRTVSLTLPVNNSTYEAPASFVVNANAADNGSINRVEFYANGAYQATVSAPPYVVNFTGVAAGSYAWTAVAYDNLGAPTTSAAAVNVTVVNDTAPTVSITQPVNNASFQTGSNVQVSATASDADGTIAKVEFFAGANLIGTVTSAPYTITWNNVQPGAYTLTAKATDNQGLATTSSPVSVTVNAAAATIFYIYADQLNTPRAITNEAATTIWKWDNVDPFGANAPNEDPDGDTNKFVFNLRFPGQYFDKETGTHYN
jgi:uncharacterized protein RhaS with RHS repeats